MKTKILGTALFATLILGVNLAYAADSPTEVTTNGKVYVKDGEIDGVKPVDPEKPGENIPVDPKDPSEPIVPNPGATGSLAITHASHIDFGSVKASTTDETVTAKPITYNDDDNKRQVRGGAYVQFADLRTTKFGYTVSARMTQQFKQDEHILEGAYIILNNPYGATQEGAKGTSPDLKNGVKLELDKTAEVAVSDSNDIKSGKGVWAVEYGSTEKTGGDDTTDTSVSLTIPANTASTMASGSYVANIEWSITAAP